MIDALKSVGLSTYQGRAMHALLQEELTLKELSRKAEIPPGKVYSVAKSLIEKGLVKASDKRPRRLFVENASLAVSKLSGEEEERLHSSIRMLHDFATAIDRKAGRSTPLFELGCTPEENHRIQMRTFVEAEKEVLQIINLHHKPKSNRKSKSAWEEEIASSVRRGVRFRAIYPRGVVLPKTLMLLSRTENFQVRRLDLDFPRCDVIDRKRSLIKLVHEDPLNFGGIIFLHDRRFSENLAGIFDRFWDEAGKTL